MPQALPTKSQVRARLKEALASLSSERKRVDSQAICQAMEVQPVWRESVVLLGFMPLPDEPDIRPLLARALALGKTLGLPAYAEASGDYGARRVADLERDLVPGKFGILEPTNECPMLPLNRLDLTLVPGVGFSGHGCRLGRGNGFYDRLLRQSAGLKCGVAFDCQVESGLPVEGHDVGVNYILTPTRWLECQGAAGL